MNRPPAPEVAEAPLEHPALFYGAHANYPRMGRLVGLILASDLPVTLVNTGQHWDSSFIGDGFAANIDGVNLNTRTSDSDVISQAAKTFLKQSNCDGVIVYGDTASALGPALAAHELDMPLIHLEGGFRTYDSAGKRVESSLPEEGIRNRVDRLANVIVPLLPGAAKTLHAERAQGPGFRSNCRSDRTSAWRPHYSQADRV